MQDLEAGMDVQQGSIFIHLPPLDPPCPLIFCLQRGKFPNNLTKYFEQEDSIATSGITITFRHLNQMPNAYVQYLQTSHSTKLRAAMALKNECVHVD